MKRKNIFIILGMILVGVIIALFLFGVFGSLSLISVQDIPEQSRSYSFDGISGIAYAPYFGSITSASFKSICLNNDGDISISNSITDGNSLTLKSSLSTRRAGCGTNYIKTSMSVPAGKLVASCVTSQSGSVGVGTTSPGYYSECMVDGRKLRSENLEIVYENPKTIDVYVYASGTGEAIIMSSSAKLTLDFREKDSCEGITCLDYCGDSDRKYNGRCVNGECVYQTQTCVFGCEDGGCNISIPERPPIVIQFFINIWEWIKGLFS